MTPALQAQLHPVACCVRRARAAHLTKLLPLHVLVGLQNQQAHNLWRPVQHHRCPGWPAASMDEAVVAETDLQCSPGHSPNKSHQLCRISRMRCLP